MSSSGRIQVSTENIFPIIKKFLYSDHEIFLRELVANAVDASRKLQALASMGEFKGNLSDLRVRVSIDKDAKTLTISDTGIGMNAAEIEKYINQIAFSGAEEFVNKYKDQSEAQLIGKFGLGFYSAFMVAAKVELISKSYREGEEGVRWECDGSPDYSLQKFDRKEQGTDVILHLAEDSLEFLEPERITHLLNKYCRFLPVEIEFQEKVINNTQPAWTRKPSELTDEDYRNFYRELYPASAEPLFWIHLNVDYPFNLTGILYFPRLKNQVEIRKDRIQLYCRQVFVTDSVEGIVPEFMTLLQGVIDSPDIPLNVSRSYLQSDGNVKKISNHIMKKVADKLEELFKDDRKAYEERWGDIGVFVKYGLLSEEKFDERARGICLLKNSEENYFTLEEYTQKISEKQVNSEGQKVFIYASDLEKQHGFIDAAKSKGYDVLWMNEIIDPHFINFLEMKLENSRFVRVDSEPAESLISKANEFTSLLDESQLEQLRSLAETAVGKERYNVQSTAMGPDAAPALVTRPEFMRRMKEMSAQGGGMGDGMPDFFTLTLNSSHPLMSNLLLEADEQKRQQGMKQITDLALLAQGLLQGPALSEFIKRSTELLK